MAARRSMARLLSAGGPGAGAFLTALPTWHSKTLSPPQMLSALRTRLGLRVQGCDELTGLRCKCAQPVVDGDPTGSHMLTCRECAGHFWRSRSYTLQLCVLRIGEDAGLESRLEVTVGGGQQRTDVTFADMPVARDPASGAVTRKAEKHVDVAIVAAHGATALGNGAWHNRGKWAHRSAKSKADLYGPLMDHDQRFTPAIAEVHGHLHSDFRQLLRDLAECKIDQSDRDLTLSPSERGMLMGVIINDYYQLVSVAVQKATANNIRRVRSLVLANHRMRGHRSSKRRAPRMTRSRALSKIGTEERNRGRAVAFG